MVERTFAHLCETGGSRRVTVRGMDKVKIWYPLRAASHNLGLILRMLVGTGKPRSFSAALLALWTVGFALRTALWKLPDAIRDLRIPPNHKLQPQRQSTGSANSNSTNHPSPPNTPFFQQAAKGIASTFLILTQVFFIKQVLEPRKKSRRCCCE